MPSPVRVSKESSQAICRRVDAHGYDIGLYAETEAGTLEFGMSYAENKARQKTVGFFFHAPRIGKFFVALSMNEQGQLELTSVSKQETGTFAAPEELTLPADDRILTALLRQQAETNLKRALKAEMLLEKQKETTQNEVTRLLSDIASMQHVLKEKERQNQKRMELLLAQVAKLESELAIRKELLLAEMTQPKEPTREAPPSVSPFEHVPYSSKDSFDALKRATTRYSIGAILSSKTVEAELKLPLDVGPDIEETAVDETASLGA